MGRALEPVSIFVPAAYQVLQISEGTGENLSAEDTDNGFVDYLYYVQYDMNDLDAGEYDGGQILKKEPVQDLYESLTEAIPEVLDFAYGNSSLPYVLLESTEHVARDDLLGKHDVELHQLYHLMHAYWYGSDDVKNGIVVLNPSYEEWAIAFIEEHGEQCKAAIEDGLQRYRKMLLETN